MDARWENRFFASAYWNNYKSHENIFVTIEFCLKCVKIVERWKSKLNWWNKNPKHEKNEEKKT